MRRILSTFTALILCALHAGAAPPNDAYPGSWVPATFPAEVSTDNIGATVQAGEYLVPSYNYGATVWHHWYARVSGPCVISSSGEVPLDTVMAVYREDGGPGSAASLVAANDDADAGAGNLFSSVSFPAVRGQLYAIQTGGYAGAEGSFRLRVEQTLPPLLNDHFAQRIPLALNAPVDGHNINATLEPGETRLGNLLSSTVWYEWTAPASGVYEARVQNPAGSLNLAIFRGTAGLPDDSDAVRWAYPYSFTARDLPRAPFLAVAGQNYSIAVSGGTTGGTGGFSLVMLPHLPAAVDDFSDSASGQLSGQAGGSGWGGAWRYNFGLAEGELYMGGRSLLIPHRPATEAAHCVAGSLDFGLDQTDRFLSIPAPGSSSQAVFLSRELAAPLGGPGTPFYVSFLIRPNAAASQLAGVWLYHGGDAVAGNSLFIGKPAEGARDQFVLEDLSGHNQIASPAGLFPAINGRTARLVVKVIYKASGIMDEARLFMDPPHAGDEAFEPFLSKPDTASYDFHSPFRVLGILSNGACLVDDIRIGTTWESVVARRGPPPVLINEVGATPDFDTNLDGTKDADDSFIELVNTSGAPLDLSAASLRRRRTATGAKLHEFPEGTVLQPGCAVLVVRGGNVAHGCTATNGTAWVQKATGPAEFDDTDDPLTLRARDSAGEVLITDSHFWPYFAASSSFTRYPDLTGGLYEFRFHGHVTAAAPVAASPGRRVFGADFHTATQPLIVSVSRGSVVEGTLQHSAVITVSLPAPSALPHSVVLMSDKPGEAYPFASPGVIPTGQTSLTVPLYLPPDFMADGDQTVTFTAISSGYLNGTGAMTVLDSDRRIYINEINAQSSGGGGGGDFGEFIELYDGGIGNKALHDFIVVLFDADAPEDGAYRVIDLGGRMTGSTGFLVIDSTSFPELTPGWITDSGGAVTIYKKRAGDGMGGAAVPPYYDFPPGTAPVVNAHLVDAIHHVTNDAPDLALVALFTPGGIQSDEGRPPGSPDGPMVNMVTARCPDARAPRDGVTWRPALPTPGTSNLTYPGFATWAATRGVTSMTADEDHDGLDNLLEYALGGIPADLTGDTDSNSQHLLPGPLENPFGELRMQFYKGPQAGFDPRLCWEIEASTDLIHWSTRDMVIIYEDCGSLTAAYVGNTPRVQLRLRVVQRP